MAAQLAEHLVAERVAQLDAIIQRRNVLLREMYRMIQHKHKIGVPFALELNSEYDDEDEGLKHFLDRFDLGKHAESGMISNMSDSELSGPFLSEETAESAEESVVPDVDSPMSEPLVYPTRLESPLQKEEDEEAEIDEAVEVAAEVELPLSYPSTSPPVHPKELEAEEEEEEEEAEEEEEEEQLLPSEKQQSVAPSPRPPSRLASTTSYHSPAASRHASQFRTPPVPSQSPQHVSVEPIPETIEMDVSEPMEDIREASPQLMLPPSSPSYAHPTEVHAEIEDIVVDVPDSTPPAPESESIPEDLPRPMVIHTAVDVSSIQPSLLIPTPTSPAPALPDFSFDDTDGETLAEEPLRATCSSEVQRHHFDPTYSLPPLKVLPPEYFRKGKSSKQKKKDKDKTDAKGGKEEWAPLGFVKWGAIIRANPVYKRVSRASKCLSTKDWGVAITELKLLRTLERVETLEKTAKWSFKQPKKQRNLGGITKTHWDYLLDEMKWMRIDFREERKWKYVLAFNISSAVLEWHEAGTREERIKQGICMHWKPPRTIDSTSSPSQQRRRQQDMEIGEGGACEQGDKEQAFSDQESGDEDEEGEAEQQDIVDSLETRNVLEEALEETGSRSGSGESGESSRRQSVGPDGVVRPKMEDVEDSSALGNVGGSWQREADAMDIDTATRPSDPEGARAPAGDTEGTQTAKPEVVDLVGLKPDSSDPILGSQPGVESQHGALPAPSPSKAAPKSNLYAPLRERIAYADATKLFIDNDDLDLVKALSDLTTEDSLQPILDLDSAPSPDLSDLFPDLQPLGMPDVAPSEPKKRSDKKSERDDNRRVDDASYLKITPIGKFMSCKPILLGPLQPVRRWKDGHWLPPEEAAIAEAESLSSKITDEKLTGLFDGVKPPSMGSTFAPHPPKEKKRFEHAWNPSEDAQLKFLVEKYPSNWTLVADSFNSTQATISTDKRTPWECLERWNLKFGGKLPSGVPGHADVISPAGADGMLSPATPSTSTQQAQMTTRGVKRLANIGAAQGQSGGAGVTVSSDTIKRRRHALMYEVIRKTAKKREATQKAASLNQRKPPNIHDTHGQYSKMPKLTPAELSRMKSEKDARDQEALVSRRRQEDFARQQLLRAQQAPGAATGSTQQLQQQPSQVQQTQPQPSQTQQQQQPQQTGNGGARTAAQPSQPIPQIRPQPAVPQVNISQQQRIPTPLTAVGPRILPQQMLQAAQARANAVVQSQGQVHAQLQVQAQSQGTPQTTLSSLPTTAHLSPPYHNRAATSSPGIGVAQQASPPRTVVTPSNASVIASPRPPSAQPQLPMPSPQIPVTAIPRPANSIPAHYLPAVGAHLTPEQMDQALRFMQRTTMAQAQQGGQYQS